ncbi:MAG TPA: hypothetical protein VGT98_03110, partial [Candidatus Elarobacter sp.]|nr:hypothetical protein [Candidatus Elarobacter sp.]
MDPLIQLELVDRDNRVIHRMPFDTSAFPLTIRITGATDAAAPIGEAPGAPISPARRGTRSGTRVWIVTAATLAVFGGITWMQTFARSATPAVIGGALGYMLVVVLYATAWAVGGRMATRSAKFSRHFVWACTCAVGALALGMAAGVVLFLAPSPITYLPITLLWIAFAGIAIFGHLGIASSMDPVRRWRIAGVAVGTIVALSALAAYAARDDFSSKLEYVGGLAPLDARVIPSRSPDDFARSLDAVKTEVDRMAAKKP